MKATIFLRRIDAVDVLRGVALALMVFYHFSFDLNYFGAIHVRFNEEPFWLSLRTVIVSLFLGLVGASMVFAAGTAGRRSVTRRLGVLALCCVLVSAASFMMFSQRWIFFGVLHFILLASLVGPYFLRWYWLNLLLGAVLVAIGVGVQDPAFNRSWLQWIGLMTFKPATEDYVPLLPWFGVVLLGMFAARAVLAVQAPLLRWRALGRGGRYLAFAGRHSLAFYMLHQPVLIGALYVWFYVVAA